MDSPSHHTSPESAHDGEEQQSTRKRKRKTFSCDTCRKRKLKCDRELPICGRCQKSGNAASCIYEHPPGPATQLAASQMPMTAERVLKFHPTFASSATDGQIHHANDAAERLVALESRMARIDPDLIRGGHNSKRPRLDDDTDIEPALANDRGSLAISFYGAGFKTGFFGPSSERTASSYYPAIVKLVSLSIPSQFSCRAYQSL
jgi:hypothetical protein